MLHGVDQGVRLDRELVNDLEQTVIACMRGKHAIQHAQPVA